MELMIRILVVILFSYAVFALRVESEVSGGHLSKNGNTTHEYETTTAAEEDYEDTEDEVQRPLTFVGKLRELHNKNSNKSVVFRSEHINDTYEALDNFGKNVNHLFASDSTFSTELFQFLTELDIHLSQNCSSALFKIISGVKQSDIWALKFLDSFGRFPPPGFIEGLSSSFGEFDECLDSRTPDNFEQQFEGKYCLLNVRLPYPEKKLLAELPRTPVGTAHSNLKVFEYYGMNKVNTVKAQIEVISLANGSIFHLGICMPSVCTAEEIETVLNKVLYPVISLPLEVERQCYSRSQPIVIDNYQLVSITIFSILTILVIIGTIVEKFQLKTRNADILTSFSVAKSMTTLFAKNEKFAALDTIRLLMIIHVHVGHIYQYASSVGLPGVKKQFSDVYDKVFSDNSMVFARSPLPVDVLFTLSGFLISYGLLRRLERSNGRFNYIQFMFQRFLRFFVLVIGSILFIYLLPLTGEGPIWHIGVNKFSNGCRNTKNLLNNFLFINNFNDEGNNFNGDKCHPVSWFLACLLQLTAIAPIFVLIYFKNRTMGILTLIGGIIMALFLAISPQILFSKTPYLQIWELDSIIFANSSSLTPYHTYPTVYLASFLVGIGFGFLLHKNKIKMSKIQVYLAWFMAILAIVTVYLWHNTFWRTDRSSSLANALLWLTVGKLAFGSGCAWVFFACCTGRAGFLNKWLSWQAFQPVARLSFGIYLTHFLIVTHRVFTVKERYEMSFKYMLEHTIVDLIYDVGLALIFYILIESPFSNVFAMAFNRRPQTEKKNAIDDNRNVNNDKDNDRTAV